jgi:hypothetical protein
MQNVSGSGQIGQAGQRHKTLDAAAGALIKTFLAVTVFARARGRIGVDGIPNLRARRRTQVVAQARLGALGS